ncbi:hypothetical protein, partial [Streptomyces lunaelactis]|uniref:hypothetical protein n=1 Tax=Streptomyces lunaelactis TaxID=1535768 RepID=UPI001C309D14
MSLSQSPGLDAGRRRQDRGEDSSVRIRRASAEACGRLGARRLPTLSQNAMAGAKALVDDITSLLVTLPWILT